MFSMNNKIVDGNEYVPLFLWNLLLRICSFYPIIHRNPSFKTHEQFVRIDFIKACNGLFLKSKLTVSNSYLRLKSRRGFLIQHEYFNMKY